MTKVGVPSLETLLQKHRALQAFHGGAMGRDHVRGEHAFELILRLDPDALREADQCEPIA